MKKKYITPLTTVSEGVEESVIAASTLGVGGDDTIDVTLTNDDYDGEFTSKGRNSDMSFDNGYDW